jgi:hypothetical protein
MPRRPGPIHRWLTAATWPIGVLWTSWDYLWRTTPLHRSEVVRSAVQLPPEITYPGGIDRAEVQGVERGRGPLFHRRYLTHVRDPQVSADELMARVRRDLNRPAPTGFARFQKVLGRKGQMAPGDEYVVRMPGPWDGPVRVVAVKPTSFRLATLNGHLEAGQIEFRAGPADRGELRFEIESWARSSGWLSNLLYHRLRMSKEVQAHMWISFLEGAVALSGGRMVRGVTIQTERIEGGLNGR